jgi:hypothetical protein
VLGGPLVYLKHRPGADPSLRPRPLAWTIHSESYIQLTPTDRRDIASDLPAVIIYNFSAGVLIAQ